MKEHIKRWRKEVVEMNRKEVAELAKLIESIDLQGELCPLDDELLKKRLKAHQKIVHMESNKIVDLKQKARVKWAPEGDENIAFFHGTINKHLNKWIQG